MADYWDGWQYRAAVTVTPPAGLSGAVTGYVALVRLDSTNFDFSKAKADGSDVRFGWLAAPAFTLHQIVKWDSVNETAQVYVYVPSLLTSEDTFYLFCGNAAAEATGLGPYAIRDDHRLWIDLVRNGDDAITEIYSEDALVQVGSGAYPAATTGLNGPAESFAGDSVAGCWKTYTGQWFNLGGTYDLVVVVLAYPTVDDTVHRPVFAQGSLANTDYALMVELYDGNWVFNNGPSVAASLNAWNLIVCKYDYDGNMSIAVNGGAPASATAASYNSLTDEDFYIGGSYAITTDGTERAFAGKIELARIGNPSDYAKLSGADWELLLKSDLLDDTLLSVGTLSLIITPTGTDEDGPTDPAANVVTIATSEILSGSVTLEEHGVVNGTIEAINPLSVGDYALIEDPLTSVDVAKLMVTKCSRDLATQTYRIQLQDPISALSQGEVLFSQTAALAALNEVATDYGQAFYAPLETDAMLAPVEVGAAIDPENEIESDPVGWVDLVRTVSRIVDKPLTYRPNGQYRVDSAVPRGALTDSQLLGAVVTVLTDRYANRVIAKCGGEWWEDPGTETTANEAIRGATMSVTRYGEQIRAISYTSTLQDHSETYTYDTDGTLLTHVTVDETRNARGDRFESTVTRTWTITDAANYTVSEETIAKEKLWYQEALYNKSKDVHTVEVVNGRVTDTLEHYIWWIDDPSYWKPDTKTVVIGFTSQPGVPGYAITETYEGWYRVDDETWYWLLIQSKTGGAAPSAPGYSVVLPLAHETVNYCVTAEDTAAQAALGLKEAIYSPVCVQDDASLTTLTAIAGNELIWRCRCRQLQGTIALSVGETWQPGDTFTWNGLTWTIERLDHDLVGRTTGITATAEASVETLKKALLPEYTDDGAAIVGIMRKTAERYDQVTPATVVSQVDYETYVVRLPDGKQKLAKLEYGSTVILTPGASIMLLRGAIQ